MSIFDQLSEKPAVIIDIGNAYTKCGFAGEPSPICIIKSEITRNGKRVNIFEYSNENELKENLMEFIYRFYYKILNINARERRIIIVESILNPINHRRILADILFKNFQVLSVTFLPSHLSALYTLGITTALVIDCGYLDTQILPIAENFILSGLCDVINVGGKLIHDQLKQQLNITNEALVEDIKVKCCFVTSLKRSELINDESGSYEPSVDCDYYLTNNEILNINGSIREKTCEILFKDDLDDTQTLPCLILDTILKAPIDLRKTFAENIVLIGGTCMLPGFKKRLYDELCNQVNTNKKYKNKFFSDFKFHKSPSFDNYTAWLGASIYGSLDIFDAFNIPATKYKDANTLPDWFTIYSKGVLSNGS